MRLALCGVSRPHDVLAVSGGGTALFLSSLMFPVYYVVLSLALHGGRIR